MLPSPYLWLLLSSCIGLPLIINLLIWRTDRKFASLLKEKQNLPVKLPLLERYPRISFLIAAWNEKKMIGRCIESVLALPYPDLELVLCAGGPDGTFLQAKTHLARSLILLEQQAGEGKQNSLQRCFEASSGEIIYLIDGDCIISSNTFLSCIQAIFAGQAEVVTGSFYIPIEDQLNKPFFLSQLFGQAYTAAHTPKYTNGLLGGNCAMTRQALEEAGAFNSPVHSGTDYDLALRLRKTGRRIYFEIFSSIESEFPTNLTAYFRQQARWIRNLIIHGLHYRKIYRGLPDPHLFFAGLRSSLLSLFMLSVPVLAILLISLEGAAWFVGISLAAIWILLFTQAFFSRLRYRAFSNIWLGMKLNPAEIFLIPVFLLIDFLAWVTPLLDYPIKSRRERW